MLEPENIQWIKTSSVIVWLKIGKDKLKGDTSLLLILNKVLVLNSIFHKHFLSIVERYKKCDCGMWLKML